MLKKLFSFLCIVSTLCAEAPQEVTPLIHEKKSELQTPPHSPSAQLEEISTKAPWKAVTLSLLCPGLGQYYLNDYLSGSCILGSLSAAFSLLQEPDETLNLTGGISLQATSYYSVFSAYRDARALNHQNGYKYQMPQDSFKQLALAPVNPHILIKPEVWGGYLGAMTAAIGISALSMNENQASVVCSQFPNIPSYLAFPIGFSEECYYRGFLQPLLSEYLGPTGGMIASSIIFAAAHIPNAQFLEGKAKIDYYTTSLPLIGALGGYFSYLTYKNNSLQECIAIHSWYDFTLFALYASSKNSAFAGTKRFQFSFTF